VFGGISQALRFITVLFTHGPQLEEVDLTSSSYTLFFPYQYYYFFMKKALFDIPVNYKKIYL
jgi:hypothetical protein